MRDTISKFTAPLFALLPDFSAAPARREATFGITVSIVFHLLLLLAVLIFGGLLPKRLLVNFAKSKPNLQEIELTVIPPEPKPKEEHARTLTIEQLEQERQRDIMDSRGLAKSKDAPENPVFESDENMKAASELAARGTALLPSQDGRTDRNGPDFANSQAALGKTVAPPEPDVAMQPPPKPVMPDTAPAAEQTKPPEPVKPTPTPQPQVAKPDADQIALSPPPVATPVPEPPAPPLPKPLMRTTATVALLNTPPRPTASQSSGYQPMQEKTRVDGAITNRGKAAVDAVRTPLGRYKKQVNDAIGSRWYYYVHERMDLIATGSVTIRFFIDAQGKVVDMKVESNTANTSFADVCIRAIQEGEIIPPPPEVGKELHAGLLEHVISFTFYP